MGAVARSIVRRSMARNSERVHERADEGNYRKDSE